MNNNNKKCTEAQKRAMKKYQQKNREKLNEYSRNYSKTYYVTNKDRYKELRDKQQIKTESCFRTLDCIKNLLQILENNDYEENEKNSKGINCIKRLIQVSEK